jgi:hypothetical protein
MLSQSIWRASRKSVARAKKITLAKESRELDKTEEQEMSKEVRMLFFDECYIFALKFGG